MKLSKISYIFITIGIIIVLGYIAFFIGDVSSVNKETICKNFEIEIPSKHNLQLISKTEIAKTLNKNGLNPVGKSYGDISTEAIEEMLDKNEMIKNAECFKTPSGTIRLIIDQRSPKYIITGNKTYYVNDDRTIMPASLNYAAYLPVVSGTITKSFATDSMYNFINYIENNDFWNDQIEQIYVTNDKKIQLIPRVGDVVISLGTLNNYRTKLDNLKTLYDKGLNVIGWNKYDRIDLEYDDQVICHKKEYY